MQDRPTVAVIVGAGASLAAGAPSTQELFDVVMRALPRSRVTTALDGSETSEPIDLANVVKEALDRRGADDDFESAMGLLEELYSYRIGAASLFASVARLDGAVTPSIDGALLSGAYSSANNAIVRSFLAGAPTTDELGARESLKRLFGKLGDRARVVVSSLNYDVFLDDALPWADGFVAQSDRPYRRFDPGVWLHDVGARERHS